MKKELERTKNSWKMMISRCNNKKATGYERYGGIGISVDKRWLYFQNFLLDMGIRPVETTLDRISGKKNYSKSNCRWASRVIQNRNRKVCMFYRDESSIDASLRLGGRKNMIYIRTHIYGWSKEKAFTKFNRLYKK